MILFGLEAYLAASTHVPCRSMARWLKSVVASAVLRAGAALGYRSAEPSQGCGGQDAQEEAPGTEPELVLHGREVSKGATLRERRRKGVQRACKTLFLKQPCTQTISTVQGLWRGLQARPPGRLTLLSPCRRCQGCFNITTVFSHSQSVVLCGSCSAVLCTPTGGKCRLTEGECGRSSCTCMHDGSAWRVPHGSGTELDSMLQLSGSMAYKEGCMAEPALPA